MSTVYLGRDNVIKWKLLINSAIVQNNTITSAKLYVPPTAFTNFKGVTYSTESSQLYLEDNNTIVVISLGAEANIKPGKWQCKLTLYDSDNPGGLAWTEQLIDFQDWRV